ncbi:unnamed protein product [Parnassius mnemosyne]|uniref:Nuclease HARBI1 n=1 Tax=Parnassius mnemosyne TaxID=213953 RepID=A0AAV1LDP3_9NEOP
MSVNSFDELLSIISQRIKKQDTNMRRSITPAERLAVTLRYLASGANFTDLEYDFQISRKTIPFNVKETCQAISQELAPLEMPKPNKEKWINIAEKFYKEANFPNCVGAIDGKHIRIVCPPNAGSKYYNYKKISFDYFIGSG